MKNLKFLLGVVSLASLGLVGFSACDETVDNVVKCTGEQPAGYICVSLNNGTSVWAKDDACTKAGAICQGTQTCNVDTKKCETPSVAKVFKFVRIDDMSETVATDEDPGADIDTVALVKNGKAPSYPEAIVGYKFADKIMELKPEKVEYARDPQKAMEVDAFVSYPFKSAPGEDTICNLHKGDKTGAYTYVSLGGKGGYLVVQMKEKIEAGDHIDVLEVGGCTIANSTAAGQKAGKDAVQVQISVAAQVDGGSWVVVGNGSGPIVTSNITAAHVQ